ncbi:unnamed protein product [Aphanomyces euteiches]|uniref:START domain-containing protein n=1 Tax=Aphanomyces euteiches TaxID=100861 RepID=A0A6G0WTC8_9STRA|nr:hypothetical protein Ae201684_011840 [Aphanomyces euteiches]KAH9089319.1 hypothetical protein Ae201684P_001519 [Aphanomyces euteiches]KAH9157390.1 hypothetical protein AeRB84_000754 [Aphanomyces euteiches]
MSTAVGTAFSMRSLLNPSQECVQISPASPISISVPPKPENRASNDRKRRHERAKARYNEEMNDLNTKYRTLEKQLREMEQNKKMKIEGHSHSPWEGFARRQAWKRQQAMIENGRLKSRLEVQMSIIKDLQAVLTKQPQLLESPLDPLDSLPVSLPRDPVLRQEAISKIMTVQLDRMNDVFVENGLLETHESWKQVSVRYDEATSELVFETTISLIFNVPVGTLSKGLDATLHRALEGSEYFNGSSKLLETNDSKTHMKRRVYKVEGAMDIHTNFIHHAFPAGDSYVWVSQSVHEDELYPIPDTEFRSRDSIWCVTEPVSETQSRLKKVRHIHLVPPRGRELGDSCPVGSLADILINIYVANTELFTNLLETNVLDFCPQKPQVLIEDSGPIIQLNQLSLLDGSSRSSSVTSSP